MDSPRDDMQSLPEGIEALRALVLTMMSERDATLAERDAAVTERDILLAQNDRLRHLLLQLRRCIVLEVGQQREPKGKMAPLCVAVPVTGMGGAGDGFQRSLRGAPDFGPPGHTQRLAHVADERASGAKPVALAVGENAAREGFRIARRRHGENRAEVFHCGPEYLLHGANSVAHALQHGVGDAKKIPQQFDCPLTILRGQARGDRHAQMVNLVLRCLVWVETTSGGRTEVELSGDEIDDGGEVSNGAIAASLCLGGLYEAVDSLDEAIGDLAVEPA